MLGDLDALECTVDDLLWRDFRAVSSKPSVDPLREIDALHDAELLDFRVDVRRATAAALFDLRAANLDPGDTAVLVAWGVRHCQMRALSVPASTASVAHYVAASETQITSGGLLAIDLGGDPGLAIEAASAAFFTAYGIGLPERPPDYGGGEALVRPKMQNWHTPIDLLSASFRSTGDRE